jgi:hypothetical protein
MKQLLANGGACALSIDMTLRVPAAQRPQLNLLKVALVLAARSDARDSDEPSKIMTRLESTC